jgi:hypothetical protein
MKKIALSIIALSTIVFFACEEKSTTNPSSTTTTTTTTGGTTAATYYVSANVNGVYKEFTNLVVYRNEDPNDESLLVVAGLPNNVAKPSIEFNIKKPSAGWSNNISYDINLENATTYIKYTTESGRVYTTSNIPTDVTPFKLNFSKFNFVKGGAIVGTMVGRLAIDVDTTTYNIADGKIMMVCEN